MSQHSGGSKNSENESGNRTPGSPGGNGEHGDKSADTSDISVDNIKEEKGSHLPQHGSPLEALSNKSRNDTLEGKKIEKKSEIQNSKMEKGFGAFYYLPIMFLKDLLDSMCNF